MLRETVQEDGHQSLRQRKHETRGLAIRAGLISLILTNLLACSGGSSSNSSQDPALASTCSPPIASGSPVTNQLNSARVNHTASLLPNGTVLVTGANGHLGYNLVCALRALGYHVRAGVRDAASVCAITRQRIDKEPLAESDYVELVDAESLEPVREIGARTLLALAVRFEGTRLIDNTLLGVP